MTASVLPFVPLADQPHRTGRLGCAACGWEGMCVWPARLEVRQLQCGGCLSLGNLYGVAPPPPRPPEWVRHVHPFDPWNPVGVRPDMQQPMQQPPKVES